MKFDPITEKKIIHSPSKVKELEKSGNCLVIPAEDGRNPKKQEDLEK